VKPVIFHRQAKAEMRAAIAYYDGEREGLGAEFQEAVETAIDQIRQMPQGFSPHGDEGMRKHIVRRFPYTIFYLELEDFIWIAAVANQRRRPGYWANRIPPT